MIFSSRTDQTETRAQGCAIAVAQAQHLLQQIAPGKLDATVHAALALIGAAWQADRAYVFVLRDMIFIDNTHEWCAPGIAPAQNTLQHIPYSVGEIFWAAFREQGAIHLRDVETIPMGSELRLVLSAQQIRSLIAVPLFDGLEICGFVGLDFCGHPRSPAPLDIPLLQSFAATLGITFSLDSLRTEHAAQTADLRVERDRIDAIIQALPELLVEFDPAGLVVGFHQSPYITLVLSPIEVMGRPPEDFLPPFLARICRKAMAQVDRDGWSESFNYTLTTDGVEKQFVLYATCKGTRARGRHQGYLFIVRDITDTYRPERQDHLFARIAELSGNLIILTDAQGRVSWINPTTTAHTGHSLADAKTRTPADLLRLSEQDPAAAAQFHARMAAAEPFDGEVQALGKADTPFWVKLIQRPLFTSENMLQGFMIIGNDVTPQKLAESRALRDRATAMDALPEAIALIERDGRCAYLNPALRMVLDLPPHLPSTAFSWHDISPAAFNRHLVDLMPRLYADGTWRGEFTWQQTAERTLYFDISISVQEDGSFLFIARDITSRKEAERHEALLREQVQIAQSRQLVAQLAGGLAHDVANVLAVIGHVTASMKGQHPHLPTEALARIDTATAQAQALIVNLSHLGRRDARCEQLDLRPLIAQAADMVRPSLGAATRFELSLPEAPLEVMADATSIMQVVLNLVLNARDALGSGSGRAARITLALSRHAPPATPRQLALGHLAADRAYARIRVRDTGIGLAPETAAIMFDPYVSTKGEGGIGLGLSIVADIVRRAQGAIRVATRQGNGTTVDVFWPLCAATPHRDGADNPPVLPAALPLEDVRILLVDDDDEFLLRTSQDLSAAGADVASCINPRDALAALRAAPQDWDVMITDQDMGSMTGLALAESVTSFARNLPIILVTGGKLLQNASFIAHPAIGSVLPKPVSSAVLVAVVRDLLLRGPSQTTSEASTDAPSDRR